MGMDYRKVEAAVLFKMNGRWERMEMGRPVITKSMRRIPLPAMKFMTKLWQSKYKGRYKWEEDVRMTGDRERKWIILDASWILEGKKEGLQWWSGALSISGLLPVSWVSHRSIYILCSSVLISLKYKNVGTGDFLGCLSLTTWFSCFLGF